ncbi:MAG: hypothetical protein KF782_15085 [Labilithrix sp.]|nr:hypothetical protein [Labilithrix sp.]
MTRRRPHARAVLLALLATLCGLALVLFPLRLRGAETSGAAEGAPAAKQASAAGRKGEKAAKRVQDAGADDAGADAEPPAEAVAPAEPAPAAGAEAGLTTLPLGKGLPVNVNVAVFFLDLKSFDDTKSEFECTTDVRLRWVDPRLRLTTKNLRGYREFRGKEVEDQLAKMWSPSIDVTNRLEAAPYVGRRLRIFPDGQVESLTRVTARYKTRVSAETFPFDRQRLALELIVRDDTTDEVLLRFDKDDVGFSRAARDAKLDGWTIGLVDLRSEAIPGWNGDRYSQTTAALIVDRVWVTSLAPIFIPLLASLIIPLLSIWMNKATEHGFEGDTLSLANMSIGGLFSVIALSFAIYSSYGVIANGDNTVTRLFGVNYAMLAITLAIVVVCFRYNVIARLFGPYVQREAFYFMSWALPVISLATSIAFLLVAAA